MANVTIYSIHGSHGLSHYSPTSCTNHQEIGQCSQESAWFFFGISSNSHRWLILDFSKKVTISIVILPTQQSFTSPPKRYIEAKIQLKSVWIEPFPIILVEFLWPNHNPTWHRCSTHGLFSGHVRTDGTGGTGFGGDPKRVEGAVYRSGCPTSGSWSGFFQKGLWRKLGGG